MSKIIVRNRGGAPATVEATCDDSKDDARVFWNAKSEYGFLLKFKCADKWYYQGLHWHCRAGQRSFYKGLVTLYRYLRQHQLVPKNTFRKMANGPAVLELRLNGIVLKRGHDDVIETMYRHITDKSYSKDEQHFEERRKALREELNVPFWEGVLQIYRLRSSYTNTPSKSPWYETTVEDDSVEVMDYEAMRRVEHEAKYGRSSWTTTAAALLKRRFGTSDPVLARELLSKASQLPPGTRADWIKGQVAIAA
jgi:hypothetical protein